MAIVGKTTKQPLFGTKVAAGFPSPADDHIEDSLDLNEHLIKNPSSTFYLRVSGESMIGAGIHEDDLLVVDRSLEPVDGKIVIAALDGELTVKRLKISKKTGITLLPENDNFDPIEISQDADFRIWGVVTNVIHQV